MRRIAALPVRQFDIVPVRQVIVVHAAAKGILLRLTVAKRIVFDHTAYLLVPILCREASGCAAWIQESNSPFTLRVNKVRNAASASASS